MASNSSTDIIKKDESDDGVYIRPSKKKVIFNTFKQVLFFQNPMNIFHNIVFSLR